MNIINIKLILLFDSTISILLESYKTLVHLHFWSPSSELEVILCSQSKRNQSKQLDCQQPLGEWVNWLDSLRMKVMKRLLPAPNADQLGLRPSSVPAEFDCPFLAS